MRRLYFSAAVLITVVGTAFTIIGSVGLIELTTGHAFGKDQVLTPLFLLLGILFLRAAWALWRRTETLTAP